MIFATAALLVPTAIRISATANKMPPKKRKLEKLPVLSYIALEMIGATMEPIEVATIPIAIRVPTALVPYRGGKVTAASIPLNVPAPNVTAIKMQPAVPDMKAAIRNTAAENAQKIKFAFLGDSLSLIAP